jgi:hypothetical protein
MTYGRGHGIPADLDVLRNLKTDDAKNIKGWLRVVYTDSGLAIGITTILTICFLVAGAGILRPEELAPQGSAVAITLSRIFESEWGKVGAILFMISGTAALCGTLMVQIAGWPRLLSDTVRICIPKFGQKLEWKKQFRLFLLFFFATNMTIVFVFGLRPVFLVKTAAVLDGLLLTPLQAIWVFIGLYVVMPKLFAKDVFEIIKPSIIFGVFLLIAAAVFGYFCIFQIPHIW